MAGAQLKELFRAFRVRDELAFRRAASEIVEEERAKQHHALARDLQRLLTAGGDVVDAGAAVVLPEPPKDREGEWALAEVRSPDQILDDLVLSPALGRSLQAVVHEVQHWTQLDAAGLPRRQRFLLHGPPGCGKTSAAAALAGELGRPLLLIRLDSVVSSYLGETASNLRRIMDYAAQAPFVVLFDEFDALGRSRDDAGDHGEMKRVVTAFLQMIDTYRGPSLILAATNHPGLLDTALWRRFDDVLAFKLPTVHELRRLLRLRLRRVAHPGVDLEAAASALRGLPHAAAEKTALDAHRNAVLRGSAHVEPADVAAAVKAVTARPWK